MRIGIDARLIEETGVGRYIRNLIKHLALIDKNNTYIIFLRKNTFDSFVLPNAQWKKVLADIPWHSLSEQIRMPFIFLKEHLDVVHIPYHNPPIFYPGNMIITIHDLIILHFDTGKATTLPPLLYKLKRLGYWLELAIGLKRAKKIIAVSETTKKEIIDHFHIVPEKIIVTYEGVDEKIRQQETDNRIIKDPYFLYVGNAYPHKNLEILISAFGQYLQEVLLQTKLVLVGREDFFYKKLKQKVFSLHLENSIIFFGYADDQQFHALYSHANALVFPSLMEGFGLPALEALSLGCPVVCSDIPVFHEILGDSATYFDSKNSTDLVNKLLNVSNKNIPTHFFEKYNWKKLAEKTLEAYSHFN